MPAQAATYRRLVAEAEAAGGSREHQIEAARRAWYEGFVAEAIDRFFRQPVMDTSGVANKGLLSGSDLAGWRAAIEEPITYDYGDYTVCKAGPWAQSPVMLQQLALLKGFDIAGMAPNGPDFVHTVQECVKLALADREAFYGDPRFVDVPLDRLLSDDYNAARRELVEDRASMAMRPAQSPVSAVPSRSATKARATTRTPKPSTSRHRVRSREPITLSGRPAILATRVTSTSSTAGAT